MPGVPKIEEEKSEEEGTPPNIAAMAVPTSIYQTSTGQYSMYAAIPYDVALAFSLSFPWSSLGFGTKLSHLKNASWYLNCVSQCEKYMLKKWEICTDSCRILLKNNKKKFVY